MKIKTIINEKFEEYILVVSLCILVFLVVMQIFFRFIMNYSVGWSEELARYLLIWIAWIAASYAVQKSAHIRVEIVKDIFNNTIKQVIDFIVLIISFGFALFLAVEGTKFVLSIQATNQVSPSLGIAMWIVYLAIPISGLLMCIRFIQQITYIFKSPKENNQT